MPLDLASRVNWASSSTLKLSASMRAENIFSPQYMASAPAAMAARKEFLSPAGASIVGVFKLIYAFVRFACCLIIPHHQAHEDSLLFIQTSLDELRFNPVLKKEYCNFYKFCQNNERIYNYKILKGDRPCLQNMILKDF